MRIRPGPHAVLAALCLASLASAAYLNAFGAVRLVGIAIAEVAPAARGGPLAGAASSTGPSDAHAARHSPPASPGRARALPASDELAARPLADPATAPICPCGLRVVSLAAARDASGSMALLAATNETARPRLVRAGDPVGPYRLWHVGWDRVWMLGPAGPCQIRMYDGADDPPRRATVAAPAANPYASKIRRLGPTEVDIDRSLLGAAMENPHEVLRARVVPERRAGSLVGYRLLGVRADSLLAAAGLQNGDVLRGVNGFDLGRPEVLLQLYPRLMHAERVQLSVEREGRALNLDVNVR
jgi:general secretion pathway protein C